MSGLRLFGILPAAEADFGAACGLKDSSERPFGITVNRHDYVTDARGILKRLGEVANCISFAVVIQSATAGVVDRGCRLSSLGTRFSIKIQSGTELGGIPPKPLHLVHDDNTDFVAEHFNIYGSFKHLNHSCWLTQSGYGKLRIAS